jgi:RNA polymerase sigma-70 factor, ECF subfamily
MHPGDDLPASPSAPAGSMGDTTFRLLARSRTGDRGAIGALFARYEPRLRRWASGRLPRWARDISDTHDIVQESLLQTFRKLGTFVPEHPGAFQAYLRETVLNRIRDEIRRCGRRPGKEPLVDVLPASGPSPLEATIGRDALDRYERALARLRPADRQAIVARLEMGFSYAEIAGALGKPSAQAARKVTERALVRLAQEMSE